jgi:hypothetical protein
MNRIRLLFSGVDVSGLNAEIAAHPEVWNQYSLRRQVYGSPHNNLSDIWVRYNDWANFNGSREAFNDEHESVWYPEADLIPSVAPIVFGIMAAVEGERLGAVLITKIPAGEQCLPHVDRGWHASYYDKYAVQLAANDKQAFHFEGEALVTKPGDVFSFDNEYTHWVTNDSDEDRVTLIICIRNRFSKRV